MRHCHCGHGCGKGVRYYSSGTKSLVEFQNGEEIHLAEPIKIDEDFFRK